MNKLKLYFVIISVALVLFSCNKADDVTPVPIREYATQYAADKITIEDYLQTYYLEPVLDLPGTPNDRNATLTKIPVGGAQMSIWDLRDTPTHPNPTFPKLLSKDVTVNDVLYTIYYLKLRDDNVNGKSLSRVDEVLTAYKGSYLTNNNSTTAGVETVDIAATQFEANEFPQNTIPLDRTIRGWYEIFPLFKTGNYDPTQTSGPAVYNNFGAGVIFIPSGLAYFYQQKGIIPAYSPLVFSFKLYDMKKADQDGDGIYSDDEDLTGLGLFTDSDTDGDGKPNYLDIDDDGDGYLTKDEIKDPSTGTAFPFADIPSCSVGGPKKYLDPTCH